jgi:F-type H+-transporting ATPase subunit delta
MASGKKQTQQLARQFFQLSLVDGTLSSDRVAGVLAYIEKHRPPQTVAVLRAYRRRSGR